MSFILEDYFRVLCADTWSQNDRYDNNYNIVRVYMTVMFILGLRFSFRSMCAFITYIFIHYLYFISKIYSVNTIDIICQVQVSENYKDFPFPETK